MVDFANTTISFKSVGVRYNEEPSDTSQDNVPISIKMPMKLGENHDGIFAMTYDLRTTIKQNLKNLILTNWGERLMNYRFGCNLKSLTMEFSTEEFDNELAIRIKTGVSRWMSFVELTDMQREVEFIDQKGMAKIKLRIFYNVPGINLVNEIIDVIFYLAG